jgi:hypothetical protein
MENKHEHIKTWADKLQETGIPYSPESWQAMKSLLDAELPKQKKNNTRRWTMTVILLLLLIGICNVPGINRFNNYSASKNTPIPLINENSTQDSSDKDVYALPTKEAHPLFYKKVHPLPNKETHSLPTSPITNKTGRSIDTENNPAQHDFISSDKKQIANDHGKGKPGLKTQRQKTITETVPAFPDSNSLTKNSPETINADSTKMKKPVDSAKNKISAAKKPNKVTPGPIAKQETENDSTEDARGFVLALGLNQFFVLGNQDKTNYNSSGTSGNLSDYIPVPVGRYYFHKWFYVQAEAQFNTPQYTKTLLIGQTEKNSFSQPAVQSVFVKKLFYFNIPLSVHYSPVKNLFIGAGLQFSLLTNGVGLIQNTHAFLGFPPTVVNPSDTAFISASVQNIKTDSSYKELKTSEWRFLVDVNYQWKRLTLGLRYNQAFSDFVNVRISTANITQAHNNSVQLYIRYMIWDKRKKFLIAK